MKYGHLCRKVTVLNRILTFLKMAKPLPSLMKHLSIFSLLFLFAIPALASDKLGDKVDTLKAKASDWYERIQIRGYTQIRYNRLLESNEDLKCDQCDKSLGDNSGFFIRRARLVLFGDVGENVYFYLQPDFASSAADQNYSQLRDLYFDFSLTRDKAHRIRVGQSKVPYGFENLQSSQNRLTPDRNDALNSALPNERDIGAFYYWATPEKRKLFSELTKKNQKGSGDYGLFGVGLYNGQTANKVEKNNNLHVVGRLTYPFEFGDGQVFEPSIQAYHGKFVASDNAEYADNRAAASIVYYPNPFGFQAEYNIGEGAEYDASRGEIRNQHLQGGYAQLMYNIQIDTAYLMPFVKYQVYQGGKKLETGAPSYDVKELEAGVEWQPEPFYEILAAYSQGDRQIQSSSIDSDESGSRLRLQLQINY